MNQKTTVPPDTNAGVGRLAFRKEGKYVNAYWAPHMTSMQDSILLGSIRESVCVGGSDGDVFKSFMALMKKAFEEVALQNTGQRPGWTGPEKAPEHERSGSA